MTRNVNEPLPDHYGTDDWENTDTLTSHLHGDEQAHVHVQTMESILAETIWNEHLFHVDALLYGDKMITPDMKMAEKLAKIVLDAIRSSSEPSEPVAVTDAMAFDITTDLREDYEIATGQTIDDAVALRMALEKALRNAGIEVSE